MAVGVDRNHWAVELLDLRPDHRVLELGCGTGAAAALVAARLTTGRLVAIDRSSTAVARTSARLGGGAGVEQATVVALAATEPPASFDVAFAVNVNLFWTTDAAAECTALHHLLTPRGVLHVVYEPPPGRAVSVGDRAAATLTAQGWRAAVVTGPAPTLVAVRALPPAT